MIVLGFDTATPSTAVALRLDDGRTLGARDDPQPGSHPGHATRLLAMADELLSRADIGWSALDRIAVGLGPGTFTGLRVGVATARGLAQSLGVELVGVSSLHALAEGAARAGITDEVGGPAGRGAGRGVLAVLDARRGEAFAAAYPIAADRASVEEEIVAPRALAPEALGSVVEQAEARLGEGRDRRWWAVGDGAIRFRDSLEQAEVTVPPDSSPAHLLSAEAICGLGARTETAAVAMDRAIVPDYGRRPDAEIALERKQAATVAQASAGNRQPRGGNRQPHGSGRS
jgi:tRNA threonylcarbamoyladenosine biosynthesis protein TsaB